MPSKHSFCIHFPKDQNLRYAREPRSEGLLAGNAQVKPYTEQKILVTSRITKFSVMEVNLATVIDMELWYKT